MDISTSRRATPPFRPTWIPRLLPSCLLAMAMLVPPPALAAEALSGDRFRADNGEIMRLAGIHAPLPSSPDWARQAKQALQTLIQEAPQTWEYAPKHPPRDRYGQISAQIFLPARMPDKPPLWLQGKLLSEGLAFVDPQAGDIPQQTEMVEQESAARHAKLGIWSDPFYAGKPAEKLTEQDEGRYAFVRGKVVDAIRIKNKVYLNFGPDWRKDFTVMIAARNMKPFRAASLDPLALKGQTILVRGWLKHNFGPMIETTRPEQITVLKEQE